MSKITTVYSSKQNYIYAVNELASQLNDQKPHLIIYFASSFYDSAKLSKQMNEVFCDATTIGCTTAGELCNSHILDKSIVAMSFPKNEIGDFTIGINEGISHSDSTESIFNDFESYFNEKMLLMNPKKYFGLVLFDGLSNKEDSLMLKIGALTNINFIGGSAADDQVYESTYIFYNGKCYTDASLLMLCKPNISFDFIKTQSFEILKQTLTCTKLDESDRTVIEFNNLPASKAYSNILGVEESKLAVFEIILPVVPAIAVAPRAKALKMSVPLLIPPSIKIGILPLISSAISGRQSIVDRRLSNCLPP
jgi:hypothetical protein